VLRLVAAAGLILVLAHHVDWSALPAQVARLSWIHAFGAFLCLSAQFVVGPWKWGVALRMHGLHCPFAYLIRAHGVGFFFNSFLPSGVGGDAYRIASTWPHQGRTSRAISAVLVDRVAGFSVLLAAGCIVALPLAPDHRYARLFVITVVSTATAAVLLLRGLRSGHMRRLGESLRRRRFFAAVFANYNDLAQARRQWAVLMGVALLFHAFGVAAIYMLFAGVGSPAPVATCVLIAAVSVVAVVIPISINGLGVVEGAFVGAAVALGEPYGPSLGVAVLMRLLVVPQTVAFGLVYALRKTSPTFDEAAPAELGR
jgi:uncharacterized protein (TIRG00374 family)